jgi:hypothetical protein
VLLAHADVDLRLPVAGNRGPTAEIELRLPDRVAQLKPRGNLLATGRFPAVPWLGLALERDHQAAYLTRSRSEVVEIRDRGRDLVRTAG